MKLFPTSYFPGYGTCNTGGCFPVPETPGGGGSNPTTTKAIPPGTPTATRTRTPRTTIPIDYSKVPRYAVQKELGSYFSQWGVYSRGFKVGKITKMTSANEITFINYAFGNIYKRNGGYECGIVNSMESGDGSGGDGYSDFGMSYNAADSVDGIADTWDQPLAGNFNQLKKLKRKYPNLRAFISIGGWTWSKWFSEAAATDDSRRQLVESCIDVYIKGNLPVIDGRGGPGSGAGVFDGIDIDWLVAAPFFA